MRGSVKAVGAIGLVAHLVLGPALSGAIAGMDDRPSVPTVRVEDGRVVNAGAPFSLALPEPWELKDGATAKDVTVTHPPSGSVCSFLLKGAGEDLEVEVKALQVAAFTGGRWSKVSSGWRTIGGRRAGELVALRTYEGKETLREQSYAVIDRGQVYLIVCQVPVSRVSALEPDVERMLETFSWSKRGRKR